MNEWQKEEQDMSRGNESVEKLSEIVVFNKYSKYREDKGRRETWDEIVQRYIELQIKKYGTANDQLILFGIITDLESYTYFLIVARVAADRYLSTVLFDLFG